MGPDTLVNPLPRVPSLLAEQGTPADDAQQQQQQAAGDMPLLPRPITLPEEIGQENPSQLAQYFGVAWKPGDRASLSPSPHRSPLGSRMRGSSGGVPRTLSESPGPLQVSKRKIASIPATK